MSTGNKHYKAYDKDGQPQKTDNDYYVSLSEASRMLGLSKTLLLRLRREGTIKEYYPYGVPGPGFVGRVVIRVSRNDIVDYITKNTKRHYL